MSLEENKAIIRSLYEAFNKHNPALLDDFVHHDQQLRDLESYKQYETMVYNGFPDVHLTIEDIIAERDKVWVRFKATETHIGEYRGLAPIGKKITVVGVEIYRIVDNKIVETGWGVYDLLDFYKKLGVIEYKGFPDENP